MKTLLYCNQDIFSGFCDKGSDVIMLGFPANRKKMGIGHQYVLDLQKDVWNGVAISTINK